jgi:hypothetical protein
VEDAVRNGVLRLTPDVPVGNRAEEAWKRLRAAQGLPAPTVEVP